MAAIPMPRFGAHMSIAGGVERAVDRIRQVGGEALQIFTRNQRQWQTPPLSDEAAARFRSSCGQWGEWPVVAHGSYLVNLAAINPEVEKKSRACLVEELNRCARLGIGALIIHPGAHMGAGTAAGVQRLAANLDRVLAAADAPATRILLETTAGQGTSLGGRFEELAAIIGASRYPERLAVCLDTAHIFAAGYDFRTRQSFEATFAAFHRIIGLDRLRAIHLNDSMRQLDSRVDRHQHIGQGAIGVEGFRLLVNDPRFAELPMILETPKGEDLEEDRANLAVLRGLLSKTGS